MRCGPGARVFGIGLGRGPDAGRVRMRSCPNGFGLFTSRIDDLPHRDTQVPQRSLGLALAEFDVLPVAAPGVADPGEATPWVPRAGGRGCADDADELQEGFLGGQAS